MDKLRRIVYNKSIWYPKITDIKSFWNAQIEALTEVLTAAGFEEDTAHSTSTLKVYKPASNNNGIIDKVTVTIAAPSGGGVSSITYVYLYIKEASNPISLQVGGSWVIDFSSNVCVVSKYGEVDNTTIYTVYEDASGKTMGPLSGIQCGYTIPNYDYNTILPCDVTHANNRNYKLKNAIALGQETSGVFLNINMPKYNIYEIDGIKYRCVYDSSFKVLYPIEE